MKRIETILILVAVRFRGFTNPTSLAAAARISKLMKTTKTNKLAAIAALLTLLLAAPLAGFAADDKKAEKTKPYLLKTCITDDEKLGSMGAPYVFTHECREIKLCCKGCLDDFKKDSAKYIKKLEAAEKKEKK